MRSYPIVLVVMAIAGGAFGVATARAESYIGARLGVSIATADVEASAIFDEENRTGFAGTVFAQFGGPPLSLQPEFSYIQKGTTDVEIDYVEGAALLKLGIPITAVKPHVFVGIGADYEVDEKSTLDIETENIDWNMLFGADVFIDMGGLAIVADARYAMGLQDVLDNGPGFSEIKNRAWILSAGLAMPF